MAAALAAWYLSCAFGSPALGLLSPSEPGTAGGRSVRAVFASSVGGPSTHAGALGSLHGCRRRLRGLRGLHDYSSGRCFSGWHAARFAAAKLPFLRVSSPSPSRHVLSSSARGALCAVARGAHATVVTLSPSHRCRRHGPSSAARAYSGPPPVRSSVTAAFGHVRGASRGVLCAAASCRRRSFR
jgi:hypothetical protein